jgi:two-component system nitrate/nitrite response regulator NarL
VRARKTRCCAPLNGGFFMAQSEAFPPEAIRVSILSAIRFYREGLELLLAATKGITVVEAAAPQRSALDRALTLRPDIVLVDISSREGIEAMHWLGARTEALSVVAMAVSDHDAEVHECARAGVAGYVTRDASLEDLVGTLTSAARGELRCPAPVSSILRRELASLRAWGGADDGYARLTLREVEILRLVSRNLSNKEIAGRLTIEVSTVKSHVHSILEKLHVRRRAEAVMRAITRRRLTPEPDQEPPRSYL